MPSAKSIAQQQYYAHPQNVFWPIVSDLFQFELSQSYAENVLALTVNKIAVWDVLAQCERKGSLDSAIVRGTEVVNPIGELLEQSPGISMIGLNGGAAFALFNKMHKALLATVDLKVVKLPSTSPAHAAMNLVLKRQVWARLLEIDSF